MNFLKCAVIIFFLFWSGGANATVLPKNGASLNFTQVMFEWDDIYGADMYSINIYRGKENNVNPIFSAKLSAIALLIKTGLEFGGDYTWEIKAFKQGKEIFGSEPYHFNIAACPRTDSTLYRQDVIYSGKQPEDLILIDGAAMAIDRSGKPVWYLPANSDSLEKQHIRDLKLTANGTFTYINNGAFEKTLSGEILWRGPDDGMVSGIGKEEYHHELIKLTDGSFAVAGTIFKSGESAVQGSAHFNTIIHYNADGSIRWKWNELNSMKNDPLYKKYRDISAAGHLNGFVFTNDAKKMIVSFKNRSDVFVLNLATGLFETSIKTSLGPKANFNRQHGPFLTKKNEVMIYNNNVGEDDGKNDKDVNPSAVIFRYDELRKSFSFVSEYIIASDSYPHGIRGKEGYVSEPQNGNILVCTGGANYSVEFTREGKKSWECYFYHRGKNDSAWQAYSNYRCRSVSSLYPLYYTMRYAGEKGNKYFFQLTNAGSDSASFNISFVRKDYKKVFKFSSVKLAPGASQEFAVSKPWAAAGNIDCFIDPSSVKADTKIYHYDFTQIK